MTHNSSLNPRELPCSTITRSLRKRLYGILLFEKRDQDPYVTEWCPENPQSYQQSVEVYPEFPVGKYTQNHEKSLNAKRYIYKKKFKEQDREGQMVNSASESIYEVSKMELVLFW